MLRGRFVITADPIIDLRDRVAIVTGAGSFHGDDALERPGQGSASAGLLASLGAKVVLADINGEAAEARAARIRESGGNAVAMTVDVRDEQQVREMIAKTVEQFGGLDVYHSNAGNMQVLYEPGDPGIVDFQVDTWKALMETHVLGTMIGCKYAIPAMVDSGGGSIICMSSIAGMAGGTAQTIYGVAKAGINQIVRSVSTQWGKHGVRANAIAPGMILSPASLGVSQDMIDEYTRLCDTTYVGEPIDTARVVAFLASDAARYITGQVIPVDGGMLQQHPMAAFDRRS